MANDTAGTGTGKSPVCMGDDVFRAVFDKIQTGIVIIDPVTHVIVDANPIALDLIGLPKEDVTGKTCHRFICPAMEGQCPITDKKQDIDSAERVLITASGGQIPILKTVAKATVGDREFLIESFVDIRDRKKAEERRVELIAYMNESVSRVDKPMELIIANLQNIVDVAKTGVYDAEDLRMQLQIQTNNLRQMMKNLQEITEKVTREETDIPDAFRKYLSGT